ncbi:hypothetical protein DIPPA_18333 [Diplonema papillatum]|nr:hypothetical protein DIPPA_18333 [Diplonema papillatum]
MSLAVEVPHAFDVRDYQRDVVSRALSENAAVVLPDYAGKLMCTAALCRAACAAPTGGGFVLLVTLNRCSGLVAAAALRSVGLRGAPAGLPVELLTGETAAPKRGKAWDKLKQAARPAAAGAVVVASHDVLLADFSAIPRPALLVVDAAATQLLLGSAAAARLSDCDSASGFAAALTQFVAAHPSVRRIFFCTPHALLPELAERTLRCPLFTPFSPADWRGLLPAQNTFFAPPAPGAGGRESFVLCEVPPILTALADQLCCPVASAIGEVQALGYCVDLIAADLPFCLERAHAELSRAQQAESGRHAAPVKAMVAAVLHGRQLLTALRYSSYGTFLAKDGALRRGLAVDRAHSHHMRGRGPPHAVLHSDVLSHVKTEVRRLVDANSEHPKLTQLGKEVSAWHTAAGGTHSIVVTAFKESVKVVHEHLKRTVSTVRSGSLPHDHGKRDTSEATEAWRKGHAMSSLVCGPSKLADVLSVVSTGFPAHASAKLLLLVHDWVQLRDFERRLLSKVKYLATGRVEIVVRWLCTADELHNLRRRFDAESVAAGHAFRADQQPAAWPAADLVLVQQHRPPSDSAPAAGPPRGQPAPAAARLRVLPERTSMAIGFCATQPWPASASAMFSPLATAGVKLPLAKQRVDHARFSSVMNALDRSFNDVPDRTLLEVLEDIQEKNARREKRREELQLEQEDARTREMASAAQSEQDVEDDDHASSPEADAKLNSSTPDPARTPEHCAAAQPEPQPGTTAADLLRDLHRRSPSPEALTPPRDPSTRAKEPAAGPFVPVGTTFFASGVPLSPTKSGKQAKPRQPLPQVNWMDIDINGVHPLNPKASDDAGEAKQEPTAPASKWGKWECTSCFEANDTEACWLCKGSWKKGKKLKADAVVGGRAPAGGAGPSQSQESAGGDGAPKSSANEGIVFFGNSQIPRSQMAPAGAGDPGGDADGGRRLASKQSAALPPFLAALIATAPPVTSPVPSADRPIAPSPVAPLPVEPDEAPASASARRRPAVNPTDIVHVPGAHSSFVHPRAAAAEPKTVARPRTPPPRQAHPVPAPALPPGPPPPRGGERGPMGAGKDTAPGLVVPPRGVEAGPSHAGKDNAPGPVVGVEIGSLRAGEDSARILVAPPGDVETGPLHTGKDKATGPVAPPLGVETGPSKAGEDNAPILAVPPGVVEIGPLNTGKDNVPGLVVPPRGVGTGPSKAGEDNAPILVIELSPSEAGKDTAPPPSRGAEVGLLTTGKDNAPGPVVPPRGVKIGRLNTGKDNAPGTVVPPRGVGTGPSQAGKDSAPPPPRGVETGPLNTGKDNAPGPVVPPPGVKIGRLNTGKDNAPGTVVPPRGVGTGPSSAQETLVTTPGIVRVAAACAEVSEMAVSDDLVNPFLLDETPPHEEPGKTPALSNAKPIALNTVSARGAQGLPLAPLPTSFQPTEAGPFSNHPADNDGDFVNPFVLDPSPPTAKVEATKQQPMFSSEDEHANPFAIDGSPPAARVHSSAAAAPMAAGDRQKRETAASVVGIDNDELVNPFAIESPPTANAGATSRQSSAVAGLALTGGRPAVGGAGVVPHGADGSSAKVGVATLPNGSAGAVGVSTGDRRTAHTTFSDLHAGDDDEFENPFVTESPPENVDATLSKGGVARHPGQAEQVTSSDPPANDDDFENPFAAKSPPSANVDATLPKGGVAGPPGQAEQAASSNPPANDDEVVSQFDFETPLPARAAAPPPKGANCEDPSGDGGGAGNPLAADGTPPRAPAARGRETGAAAARPKRVLFDVGLLGCVSQSDSSQHSQQQQQGDRTPPEASQGDDGKNTCSVSASALPVTNDGAGGHRMVMSMHEYGLSGARRDYESSCSAKKTEHPEVGGSFNLLDLGFDDEGDAPARESAAFSPGTEQPPDSSLPAKFQSMASSTHDASKAPRPASPSALSDASSEASSETVEVTPAPSHRGHVISGAVSSSFPAPSSSLGGGNEPLVMSLQYKTMTPRNLPLPGTPLLTPLGPMGFTQRTVLSASPRQSGGASLLAAPTADVTAKFSQKAKPPVPLAGAPRSGVGRGSGEDAPEPGTASPSTGTTQRPTASAPQGTESAPDHRSDVGTEEASAATARARANSVAGTKESGASQRGDGAGKAVANQEVFDSAAQIPGELKSEAEKGGAAGEGGGARREATSQELLELNELLDVDCEDFDFGDLDDAPDLPSTPRGPPGPGATETPARTPPTTRAAPPEQPAATPGGTKGQAGKRPRTPAQPGPGAAVGGGRGTEPKKKRAAPPEQPAATPGGTKGQADKRPSTAAEPGPGAAVGGGEGTQPKKKRGRSAGTQPPKRRRTRSATGVRATAADAATPESRDARAAKQRGADGPGTEARDDATPKAAVQRPRLLVEETPAEGAQPAPRDMHEHDDGGSATPGVLDTPVDKGTEARGDATPRAAELKPRLLLEETPANGAQPAPRDIPEHDDGGSATRSVLDTPVDEGTDARETGAGTPGEKPEAPEPLFLFGGGADPSPPAPPTPDAAAAGTPQPASAGAKKRARARKPAAPRPKRKRAEITPPAKAKANAGAARASTPSGDEGESLFLIPGGGRAGGAGGTPAKARRRLRSGVVAESQSPHTAEKEKVNTTEKEAPRGRKPRGRPLRKGPRCKFLDSCVEVRRTKKPRGRKQPRASNIGVTQASNYSSDELETVSSGLSTGSETDDDDEDLSFVCSDSDTSQASSARVAAAHRLLNNLSQLESDGEGNAVVAVTQAGESAKKIVKFRRRKNNLDETFAAYLAADGTSGSDTGMEEAEEVEEEETEETDEDSEGSTGAAPANGDPVETASSGSGGRSRSPVRLFSASGERLRPFDNGAPRKPPATKGGRCYHCAEFGHWASECPQKQPAGNPWQTSRYRQAAPGTSSHHHPPHSSGVNAAHAAAGLPPHPNPPFQNLQQPATSRIPPQASAAPGPHVPQYPPYQAPPQNQYPGSGYQQPRLNFRVPEPPRAHYPQPNPGNVGVQAPRSYQPRACQQQPLHHQQGNTVPPQPLYPSANSQHTPWQPAMPHNSRCQQQGAPVAQPQQNERAAPWNRQFATGAGGPPHGVLAQAAGVALPSLAGNSAPQSLYTAPAAGGTHPSAPPSNQAFSAAPGQNPSPLQAAAQHAAGSLGPRPLSFPPAGGGAYPSDSANNGNPSVRMAANNPGPPPQYGQYPGMPGRNRIPGHSGTPGNNGMPGHNVVPGHNSIPGHSGMPGQSVIPGHNSVSVHNGMPGHNSTAGNIIPGQNGTPGHNVIPSLSRDAASSFPSASLSHPVNPAAISLEDSPVEDDDDNPFILP